MKSRLQASIEVSFLCLIFVPVDDVPIPFSQVSRQTSRFMFEDDWVDDYEDFDVTDTEQRKKTHSRPRATHQEAKAERHEPPAPSTAQRRRLGDHSASSGRDLSASSGSGRGVTWRSPYSNVPVPGITEAYRRPERHLTAITTPSGEQDGNYPAEEGKQSQTRRPRTFVATPKTPANEDGDGTSVASKPFVVRVSYGGKSGRTTKELKFGPDAARNFLSRAQMRRWSFTSGSPIAQRMGVTETAKDQDEQAGTTARGTRTLEKAGDKTFDFEIGRRTGETQLGLGSQVRARSVLPRDVTNHRVSSSGTSRQVYYRPPPTRPMARRADLAEVAPPETSVEPPTVVVGYSAGNRGGNRYITASEDSGVQRKRAISEGSTNPSHTPEESQREEASSVSWGGHSRKPSFAELTTDSPGSPSGGNELIADDSEDIDYDVFLHSESFKNFGMKLPSAPFPHKYRQSPG